MIPHLTLKNGKLTASHIKEYWQNGYLFPIKISDIQKTQNWLNNLEALEKKWLNNNLPLPLNTYKRVNAQIVMTLACEIGLDKAILDVVEGILGEDIMLYSVEFLIKEPHTKHIVTMHQDLAYWGMGEMDSILTAWLALTDATLESGCMEFVQASHKNPILPHVDSFDDKNLLSRGQEISVDVKEKDKIPIILPAGSLSLHHGLTIHGSGQNKSNNRRVGVAIRYISAKMYKDNKVTDFAMPARGSCTHSHFTPYKQPKIDFDSEDLKFYNHVRTEQAKTMMAGASKSSKIY